VEGFFTLENLGAFHSPDKGAVSRAFRPRGSGVLSPRVASKSLLRAPQAPRHEPQ
jgi:hypothetical protein